MGPLPVGQSLCRPRRRRWGEPAVGASAGARSGQRRNSMRRTRSGMAGAAADRPGDRHHRRPRRDRPGVRGRLPARAGQCGVDPADRTVRSGAAASTASSTAPRAGTAAPYFLEDTVLTDAPDAASTHGSAALPEADALGGALAAARPRPVRLSDGRAAALAPVHGPEGLKAIAAAVLRCGHGGGGRPAEARLRQPPAGGKPSLHGGRGAAPGRAAWPAGAATDARPDPAGARMHVLASAGQDRLGGRAHPGHPASGP